MSELRVVSTDGVAVSALAGKDCERSLVATRNMAAGEIVLAEDPFAASLLDAETARRCHHTFRPATRLLRCSVSKFGRFESRSMQSAAWADGFKEECAALVACAPRVPPPTIRLAARAEWRLAREPSKAAQLEGLLHHWEQLPEERKLTYAQMATLLGEYRRKGLPEGGAQQEETSGEDTRRGALLLARLACNVMSICDEELRPIGLGLYLTAAMANHSCRPNCAQTFDGKRLVLRALTPIQAGEEVTIAYIELAATRQERRMALLQQYFFDLDGPGAPPGPAPGQGAVLPGASAQQLRPGLLLATIAQAQPPWRTDQVDADLTAVDASGQHLLMLGALVPGGDVDSGASASDGFDIGDEERSSDGSPSSDAVPARPSLVGMDEEDDDEDREADALGALGRVELYGLGEATRSRATLGAALWLADALRYESHCDGLLKQGRAAEALEAVSTQLRRPAPNGATIGPRHIIRIRLMQLGLRAAIETSQWQEAIALVTALTPALEAVYPPSWPALALHLASHAKLVAMDAQSDNALRAALHAAQKAAAMLKITHGSGSAIFQEMDTLCYHLNVDIQQQQQQQQGDD